MKRALVVGLGASGLYASKLLMEKGWQVTAVGRGTPMTALSTGCLKGDGLSGECRGDVMAMFKKGGMELVGGGRARTGITDLGTRYDCWLSPSRSTWAEGDGPRTITVMAMGDDPAPRPVLAAAVLNTWGPKAKAHPFPLSLPPGSQLSSFLHDSERSEALVKVIKEAWGEAVLLPPLYSLGDYGRYDDLERRGGRRILEAVTPLGTPGARFLEVLRSAAVEAGAELWPGRKVTDIEARAGQVNAAVVQGGLEARRLELDAVLLATGGPLSDGPLLRPTGLTDPFAHFKIESKEDALRGGYAHADGRLRSGSGSQMANVFGAGDCLASPQRKCGHGLTEALESAWRAVQAMEAL